MITLQKILTELKAESLNEIVAGRHGSSHSTSSRRSSRKTRKSSGKKRYNW